MLRRTRGEKGASFSQLLVEECCSAHCPRLPVTCPNAADVPAFGPSAFVQDVGAALHSERSEPLPVFLGIKLSLFYEMTEIGSLHNKHGDAGDEHCHCGDRHDRPCPHRAWLALHQFLVRSDDEAVMIIGVISGVIPTASATEKSRSTGQPQGPARQATKEAPRR